MLNLGSLLGTHSLELDCLALVFHFGDSESQIKLLIVFLEDVIEGKFDYDLAELWVGLASLYCLWMPDDIINLARVASLVRVLSYQAEGERDSDTSLAASKLLSITLRYRLFLKHIYELMRSHIHENFVLVCILGLHNEAWLRLDHSSTFLVDDRLALSIDEGLLVALKLRRHLPLHQLLIHSHDLLMCEIFEHFWKLSRRLAWL